jgi:hypothetical protein
VDELAEAVVQAQAQAQGSERSAQSAEARAHAAEAACAKKVTSSEKAEHSTYTHSDVFCHIAIRVCSF